MQYSMLDIAIHIMYPKFTLAFKAEQILLYTIKVSWGNCICLDSFLFAILTDIWFIWIQWFTGFGWHSEKAR